MARRIVIAALAAVLVIGIIKCDKAERDIAGALYSTDEFTVWADSMIAGGKVTAPALLPAPSAGVIMAGSDTLPAYLFNRGDDCPNIFVDPLLHQERAIATAFGILDSLNSSQWQGLRYPVVSSKAMDLAYAADVVTATGSAQLRQRVIDNACRVIAYERRLLFCDSLYLFRGIDRATLSQKAYPEGVDADDMAMSLSYANNIAHARILDFLANELEGEQANGYASMRDSLINSIDTYFWLPDRGYYSRLITGNSTFSTINNTDIAAQSKAVEWGLTSAPIIKAMASSTPILSDIVPSSYPLSENYRQESETATSLWCVLAGKAANQSAMSAGLGMLCAQNLGYGIRVAMLRGVIGIDTRYSDRMTFSPYVPDRLGGEISVSNLKYHDALLTINLHGTGNIISTFSVDGKAQLSHFIPSSLSGNHTIDITLVGREENEDEINITTPRFFDRPEIGQSHLGDDSISVEFADFARPYARSLRDKKLARKYVESTRYRNKSLKFSVDIPSSGYYYFTIKYINGEGIVNPDRLYALRTLKVNDSEERIIVFPQLNADQWRHDLDWQLSTGVTRPIKIALDQGVNNISLDYFDPEIDGFNHDANTLITLSATFYPIAEEPQKVNFNFRKGK